MTREEAADKMKMLNCDYATVVVDVCSNDEVTYPKEKVIVSLLKPQNRKDFIGKAYCVFDSIKDFVSNSVFGKREAEKYLCKYYFGEIHAVYRESKPLRRYF